MFHLASSSEWTDSISRRGRWLNAISPSARIAYAVSSNRAVRECRTAPPHGHREAPRSWRERPEEVEAEALVGNHERSDARGAKYLLERAQEPDRVGDVLEDVARDV